MDEKLKKMVEDVVTAIFASKEEADKRQKTVDALETSATEIASLQKQLEEVNVNLEQVSKELETSKAEVTELNVKIEAAKSEEDFEAEKAEAVKEVAKAKEAVESKLEKVSLELSTLKQEITAKQRMSELESAGVLREDSEAQKAKIMDMTDEDFTAYKDELVEVKEQVVASLKESMKSEDAGDGVTPPANVDPDKSEQASLNLETPSSKETSIEAQMKRLGEAMAKQMETK